MSPAAGTEHQRYRENNAPAADRLLIAGKSARLHEKQYSENHPTSARTASPFRPEFRQLHALPSAVTAVAMAFSRASSWRKFRKLQSYTLSRAKSTQVVSQRPNEFKDTRDSSINRFNEKEVI